MAAPVRDQVLDQLRQAIVQTRLRPGQRLVERELIEQTGVSRTTIREVLRQLAAEGLVTTVPHKGTVVTSVSPKQAAELYEVRAVLEGMAGRLFAQRATEKQLRELRRAFEEIEKCATAVKPRQTMLAAKTRFYGALFDGAANDVAQEVIEGLQARVTSLRSLSLAQEGRTATAVEELREIVEAAEARDADRTAAACVHHVNQAAATVVAAMAD
ncbi:GntR family transcriptional regulator [Allokutzneria sp. NRRL B-24872]|uniref:GntR family transcriptional regulator n=1 Tax=Allokutzneria sp. NRRL B-24872 TaxID=1137961 RepID=UPI00143D612B|nr:GntR family transcriptional regulator [Allokutzneria sp. NRRL B-24872]